MIHETSLSLFPLLQEKSVLLLSEAHALYWLVLLEAKARMADYGEKGTLHPLGLEAFPYGNLPASSQKH